LTGAEREKKGGKKRLGGLGGRKMAGGNEKRVKKKAKRQIGTVPGEW